jgi:hypothetical protein
MDAQAWPADAQPFSSEPLTPAQPKGLLSPAQPRNFFCLAILMTGGILTLAWIGILSWLLIDVIGVCTRWALA